MRVYPGVRLTAFTDPAQREQIKILDDAFRDQTAALSGSVFPGTRPAANPIPTAQPPGSSPFPSPTTGDLLYGLVTGSWAKLPIGAASTILAVSGGIPAWSTPIVLLPVHDHSNAAQGGNIPEASITDGAILARVGAAETITAEWIFEGSFVQVPAPEAGGYSGLGLLLQGNSSKTQLVVPNSQVADSEWKLPAGSGSSTSLVGNTETTTLTNKIMGASTKLRTNAAASSCVFQDSVTTTKQFAIDLAGCTASTLSVLDINSTAARTWTLQDVTGTLYQAGGTDVAIADGGTGASTATTGFNALSPVTTRGDLIVRDASDNVRLAVGAASTVLKSDGTDPSWGTISAAHIDSRTRNVFLPAQSWFSSIVMSAVGTNPNTYVGFAMPGAGASYANTTWVLPQDFVTSGAVEWKVIYTNGGTSNNGTHWDVYYEILSNGPAATGAADVTMSGDDPPGTTLDSVNVFAVGTTNTSLVAGSILRLTISRDAANAGDTNASDMYFIGLQLDYTADM